ncbi:MAG: hypothetical protein AVDCRST_MAG18-4210, partial [uncultured Thermomicrobiales bacterium]
GRPECGHGDGGRDATGREGGGGDRRRRAGDRRGDRRPVRARGGAGRRRGPRRGAGRGGRGADHRGGRRGAGPPRRCDRGGGGRDGRGANPGSLRARGHPGQQRRALLRRRHPHDRRGDLGSQFRRRPEERLPLH